MWAQAQFPASFQPASAAPLRSSAGVTLSRCPPVKLRVCLGQAACGVPWRRRRGCGLGLALPLHRFSLHPGVWVSVCHVPGGQSLPLPVFLSLRPSLRTRQHSRTVATATLSLVAACDPRPPLPGHSSTLWWEEPQGSRLSCCAPALLGAACGRGSRADSSPGSAPVSSSSVARLGSDFGL